MATIGASLAVPAGTGVGAASATANMAGKKTILVSGVFSGQVIVEIAAVAGGPFCQLRTFTAPKSMVFEVACAEMRVSSQNVGGAPVVDVSAEEAVVQAVNLAVPAGNGSGAGSDISALGELMTAVVLPYGSGSCIVELSEDNVNWVQAFSTFTPAGGCQTKEKPANFARVTRAGVTVGAPPVVQLAAISGAGGGAIAIAEPRTCFVFRPGGVAVENVYTDFTALMAAVNSVEGCKEILFDDSLLSPCVIPAGAWDFTDVVLNGINIGTPVSVSDGATFTSSRAQPLFVVQRIAMTNLSTASPITMANAEILRVEQGGSLASNGGPGIGLVDIPAGPVVGGIQLADLSSLVDAGQPVVTVAAGSTLSLVMEGEESFNDDDTIAGAGNAQASALSSSARVSSAQAALVGGLAIGLPAIARDRYGVPAVDAVTPAAALHGQFVRVDATAGDFTVNLPPSTPGNAGQSVVGAKIDAGANNVIMAPAGADTIVGPDRTATAFGAIKLVDMGDGTWKTESVL